jgi:hypothetical protein
MGIEFIGLKEAKDWVEKMALDPMVYIITTINHQ